MIVDTDPHPIRQIGWTERTNFTRDPRRLPAPADNPWRPCPMCWAAGRIYATDLVNYSTCPTCIGVGSIPSTGRTR